MTFFPLLAGHLLLFFKRAHNVKMKGMKMDHHHTDQEWNKLQAHIDQMFGRFLKSNLDLIEYKPSYAIHLLETSRDDRDDRRSTW
jgi:hypothetical protein